MKAVKQHLPVRLKSGSLSDASHCFTHTTSHRTAVHSQADGMDALAVKQVVSFAKKYVLEHGPMILELDTYRYGMPCCH
jgi:TPP-dependent pyruvate/acetoin dehydrogenase alpha subunit